MKIAIAGGTGLVGKALTNTLIKHGHEVYILTRNVKTNNSSSKITYVSWLNSGDYPEESLKNVDAFINLAGESINSGRWTEKRKERIKNSRIQATNEVIRIMTALPNKPKVLINASAIGFYGTSYSETFTEDSVTPGHDFLASTVKDWEKTARKAESLGVRTVLARFGIILDKNEGALPKLLIPYKLFAGGNLGTGEQWMSWIHIDDVVHGLIYCLQTNNMEGPVNFVSPQPLKMKEFGLTLGRVLQRPHWFPTPVLPIKLALGEMSLLILEGQKVLPTKLHDYHFLFPTLEKALKNILQNET